MSHSLKIEVRDQLTVVTLSGQPTFAEVLAAVLGFYADNPTPYVLWDTRQMPANEFTSGQIETLAHLWSNNLEARPHGKTALVAQSTVVYGLSRMFSAYSEVNRAPGDVRVFREMNEALQWLAEEDDDDPPSPR